jgi:hypothetical protein
MISRQLLVNEIIARWNALTFAEVERNIHHRDRLAELLQVKYGFSQRRAEREIDALLAEFDKRMRLAIAV